MYPPEVMMQITQWRQQAVEGTLTQDELRKAILALRQTRKLAAATTPAARRKTATLAIPDADTLLAALGGE